jgi:REP element-mobilizing transposase RayT
MAVMIAESTLSINSRMAREASGASTMEFDELLAQVIALLQRQGRVSYGALKRRYKLDDDYLEDLKVELIEAQGLAADEQGRILIWLGSPAAAPLPTAPSASDAVQAPLAYTPPYLTEKILASRATLEGERKQVTILFADTKGSMELIQGLDPEDARRLLDPAIQQMMDAVHRYEGTVNQVLSDGIMALFGAPLAHEDHALRACYAALAMQAIAVHAYVLMTNRVHMLMTPHQPNSLAKVLQALGRRYVPYINATYQRTGTLWEGRYRASLVDAEQYLFACNCSPHPYICVTI